ncbi:MAG TPA: four helix bundle protein [Gemmata sp.]|jgi:four helix bundle protein|nr:four helix bundle protein [Gemmata sp.]
MGKASFEQLHVYRLAECLANDVWKIVTQWGMFARDTIGKQFVRAADSIGSNLAEGHGRGSYADNKRFVHIARGSLNETICWVQRAATRKLLTPEQVVSLSAITDELGPRLNAYLNFIIKQLQNKAVPGQPPKG